MFKLICSNLVNRPTRNGVSVVAVSLGVLLILVTVGLSYGQLNDYADRTRRIGGDFMLQPPGSSLLFALNSGTIPVKLARVVREVEGVEEATPVLAKFSAGGFQLVYGIEKGSFSRVNQTLRLVKGRYFESPDEVIIDTKEAATAKLGVGSTITLWDRPFRVAGVFQEGTAARVMMSLSTLQDLNGTPDKATTFFIRKKEGASEDTVYKRLKERFKGYTITRTSDLQEMMTALPGFKPFLMAVVGVSVAISFLIILLSMYSTITERTREIGILKSLGASKSYIVQLILRESILICSAGALLGFGWAFVAIKLIAAAFPSLPVMITGGWKLAAVLMALLGGTLGALYPAVKAAQLDPVRALGYE
jgi:putative ABC transport system permease protein